MQEQLCTGSECWMYVHIIDFDSMNNKLTCYGKFYRFMCSFDGCAKEPSEATNDINDDMLLQL